MPQLRERDKQKCCQLYRTTGEFLQQKSAPGGASSAGAFSTTPAQSEWATQHQGKTLAFASAPGWNERCLHKACCCCDLPHHMIDADGNVRHQEEDHQMLMLSRGKWRSIGNVRRRGLAVEH
jgi:hypothetical protein